MFKREVSKKGETLHPSADINAALKDTMAAIVKLGEVLKKETAALKESKSALFLEIQDEKVEAARRYETLVTSLMSRGADIKNADEKLKSQLETMQNTFGDITAENLKWIERVRNATHKLGETIMRSARKSAEKQTQFAYGASGKMQKGNKTLIGFDERA